MSTPLYYARDVAGNIVTRLTSTGTVDARFIFDGYGKPTQLTADWSTFVSIEEDQFLFGTHMWRYQHAGYDVGMRTLFPDTFRFMQAIGMSGIGKYLYGFVSDDTNATECYIRCGPDITQVLIGLVNNVNNRFGFIRTTDTARLKKACKFLSPIPNTERGSLLDPGYLSFFDIQELYDANWTNKPPYQGCATPKECEKTVMVQNKCFLASEVNYILFGIMHKLCSKAPETWQDPDDLSFPTSGGNPFTRINMNIEIWAYLQMVGPRLGDPDTKKAWANAGFDGWPEVDSPPASKPKCKSCNKSRNDLSYYWRYITSTGDQRGSPETGEDPTIYRQVEVE